MGVDVVWSAFFFKLLFSKINHIFALFFLLFLGGRRWGITISGNTNSVTNEMKKSLMIHHGNFKLCLLS